MLVQPKILLVDDDGFSASLTSEMLSPDEYLVEHVENGQAALDSIRQSQPDLVLLDVDMPGMSGYEVCRKLREDQSIGELPVIFLSGMVGEADRLAGYEAGGDDYLTKPVAATELRSKINLELLRFGERIRLKNELSVAFSTAMSAMSGSAEIGTVLQFMLASFKCSDYAALCGEVLNTLGVLGVAASVRVYGRMGDLSLSSSGQCSPLEVAVLTNMATQGRLFEFSSRISCSFEHITVIVKSDIHDDPERHGRLKDNLALLAEGANARISAIDSESAVGQQHSLLGQIKSDMLTALQAVDQLHRTQSENVESIFKELQRNFKRSLTTLGVTYSQEEEISEILQTAESKASALFESGLEIQKYMKSVIRLLDSAALRNL